MVFVPHTSQCCHSRASSEQDCRHPKLPSDFGGPREDRGSAVSRSVTGAKTLVIDVSSLVCKSHDGEASTQSLPKSKESKYNDISVSEPCCIAFL